MLKRLLLIGAAALMLSGCASGGGFKNLLSNSSAPPAAEQTLPPPPAAEERAIHKAPKVVAVKPAKPDAAARGHFVAKEKRHVRKPIFPHQRVPVGKTEPQPDPWAGQSVPSGKPADAAQPAGATLTDEHEGEQTAAPAAEKPPEQPPAKKPPLKRCKGIKKLVHWCTPGK